MLFRSHDSTLKEHTAQLTDHSTKLSSLMTSVADITKSIAMMHAEMREGFQLQHHPGKQKDKEETEKERSPISSFVLTGEEEKQNSSYRVGPTDQFLEDVRSAARKIELPFFRGEDPFSWVSRAEAYFAIQGTPPELQLEFAQICMEGPSWHWYKMLKEENSCLDWEKFKRAFFDRFGDQFSGNLFMQLKMLRQEGSVDEFVEEFEMVASQISGMSTDQYLGLFIGGLKEEIRMEVQILEPTSRYKAISMARNVERKLVRAGVLKAPVQGRRLNGFQGGPLRENLRFNSGKFSGSPVYKPVQNSNPVGKGDNTGDIKKKNGGSMRGTRNLSYQELMDRRAKGLCFKCGQHYSPMHQCPEKELRLLVQEEDEEEILENREVTEETKGETGGWEMICHVVELNDLRTHVKTYCRTMKLEGYLQGLPILLLIDSGASHNYVTRELVTSLNLPVTDTREFAVTLGDGSRKTSRGRCEGLIVAIGKNLLQVNAYVLEIKGIDIILGMEWLETLGEVKSDWKKKTMSFEQGGCTVILKGY